MAVARMAALLILIVSGFGQDSTTEAMQKYREELEQNPRNSLAHFRMGELFLVQHNLAAAANEFQEALHGDPHPRWIDAWAHIDLGEVFDVTNRRGRAVQEYQMAAQTADNTEGAQDLVAQLLTGAVKVHDEPLHRILPGYLLTPVNVLKKVTPEYSREARIAGLEGIVTFVATIAADGSVVDLDLIGPLGLGLDEAAEAAAKRWFFERTTVEAGPALVYTTIELNFLLPSKQSRWHLVRVAFGTPEGASRPHFVSASYPSGVGVSPSAVDEARLVEAIGRQVSVTLSFDVDQAGRPVHFVVDRTTQQVWGKEAVSFVSKWKFLPGSNVGHPMTIPCTVDLIYGERAWR